MINILLIEPAYKTRYPPLPLMKISSYHKGAGDKVTYAKGIAPHLPLKDFDLVYITSLYTYEASITLETVNFYRDHCINADIILGGVFFSLMPDYVYDKTGLRPQIGLWMEVEFLPPDYSLVPDHPWSNHSFVFTARGCPNKCGFCAVNILEPKRFTNPRWKEHISPSLPKIMVHDNNITTADFEHYTDVMETLSQLGKPVTFDNGFDCRYFTDKHCSLLQGINVNSIRFAFDTMKQDGYLQRAIKLCLKLGIPASKILVYVLFNFHDEIDDAIYRAKEISKLGARPYAMQYTPLDATESFSFYSEKWDRDLCRDFTVFVNELRFANVMPFQTWRDKWRRKKVKYRNTGD